MARPLDNLLQKEMSRKEFLATVGFGLASILGFSSLIKLLSSSQHNSSSLSYGSSPYGGNKSTVTTAK